MSTKEQRIKISQDRTYICRYCVGDEVIVIFRKYGNHKFVGRITEVCENLHGLDGIWISAIPVKEYESDDVAKRMILNKVGVMVPLKDIRDLPN